MLEDIKTEIEQQRQFTATLETLQTAIEDWRGPATPATVTTFGRTIIFSVTTMDGVTAMRDWLRKALGSWDDRLMTRWYSCGKALTSWESEKHPGIQLRLDCPLKDYPEELQSEHCHWESTEHRERTYMFVCDNTGE